MLVQGDTSFNGAVIKLDAYFNSETAGRGGCSFEGGADFVGLQVGGLTLFDDAHFAKSLAFRKTKLSQDGYFRRCRFSDSTDFSGVDLIGDFHVNDSEFDGDARFDRCHIGGGDFTTVNFHRTANFENISISGAANFKNVSFHGDANFQGARFQGEAHFQSAQFHGSTDFVDCGFAALASFSGETQQRPTSFNTVTFDHSRFLGDARFEKCLFLGPASFADASFRSVSFEKEESQFTSTVNLSGCTYDRIVTNWRQLLFAGDKSRLAPYDREAGIQLESTLRKIGEDGEAADLYLRRKSVERSQKWEKSEYLPWFADAMYKLFANYGVRPRALFLTAAVLVATGTFIFSFPSTVVSNQAKDGQVKPPVAWSNLKGLGVSIHQFLPIDVPIGSEWKPSPELLDVTVAGHHIESRYVRPSGLATLLLRIPGWILVPLAVANLAGILRRSGTPVG